MTNRERTIEEMIRAAMKEGAFENLPGKGRPLNMEQNPYLEGEWELAYHLLKENGYSPDFIEARKGIEADLAEARKAFTRAWSWRTKALAEKEDVAWVESQWAASQARFKEHIEDLNNRIRDYNLMIPADSFSRSLLDIEEEIDNINSYGLT